MYRNLLSVGGLTLLSRVSGFARDIALAAALGGGALNDAFAAAFKLPNQFRAIFGEGAFNTAFVPSYSRVLQSRGAAAAGGFASRIFTLLLISQIILLALAWLDTPLLVGITSPGWEAEPEKFGHAVTMTRIMFPYLLFVTLVTLHQGVLNANGAFAAAAFAPVLLNLSMIGFLAVAFLFPNAGEAASWGVTASGVAQLALVMAAARKRGLLETLAWPNWSADVRQFFRALAPAIIGSAGVQIAILADQIIASLLPTGAPSSIYYAERLYQLPIGVIGIAAGTVLLPEMSRRLSRGDEAGAAHAQNRAAAISLALSAPFVVAFAFIPEPIMRGAFLRGAFTSEAARNAAAVLAAYSIGLTPIVLIRSAVASFQARGDTLTPMLIALFAIAVNVALKFSLYRAHGAAGLAFATSIGAWINFALLVALGRWRGWTRPDATLGASAAASVLGCGGLAMAIVLAEPIVATYARALPRFAEVAQLTALTAIGALAYFALLAVGLIVLGVRLPRRAGVRN